MGCSYFSFLPTLHRDQEHALLSKVLGQVSHVAALTRGHFAVMLVCLDLLHISIHKSSIFNRCAGNDTVGEALFGMGIN